MDGITRTSDEQKKRWSKVNLENIKEARIDGKTYKFE